MPGDDYPTWKSAKADRAVTVKDLQDLARRLRKRAYWEDAGEDPSDMEAAVGSAVIRVCIAVADEMDTFFGFDSALTADDKRP